MADFSFEFFGSCVASENRFFKASIVANELTISHIPSSTIKIVHLYVSSGRI